jgi:hypothetical protein
LSAGAKLLSDFIVAEELPDHGGRILVRKAQRGKSEAGVCYDHAS